MKEALLPVPSCGVGKLGFPASVDDTAAEVNFRIRRPNCSVTYMSLVLV